MSTERNRCTRRGPKTGAQCCKLVDEHEEHHALLSGEKWTDRDIDACRATLDRRAKARQALAALLELPAEDVREVLTRNREVAGRLDRLVAERAGTRPIVVVESPYAGNVEENLRYARAAVRQCAKAGMVPLASHLLYTQPGILDDKDPAERTLGIQLGFEVRRFAARTLVFTDLGISAGMMQGIADAERQGCPIEFCRVEGWTWGPKEESAACISRVALQELAVLSAGKPPPFLRVGMVLNSELYGRIRLMWHSPDGAKTWAVGNGEDLWPCDSQHLKSCVLAEPFRVQP